MSPKAKKIIYGFFTLACFTILICCSFSTIAAPAGGTGGGSGGGGGGGGYEDSRANDYYNCGYADWTYCPLWRDGNIEEFIDAWNHKAGNYNGDEAYEICTDTSRNRSGRVIFAGTYHDSHWHLFNLLNRPSYWYGGNPKIQYSDYDGGVRTNNEALLNAVLYALGTDEDNLAFFCEGLVSINVSYNSVSEVTNITNTVSVEGNVYTIPKEKSSASVTFHHYLTGDYLQYVGYTSIVTSGAISNTENSPSEKDLTRTIKVEGLEPGESKEVCQTANFSPKTATLSSDGGTLEGSEGTGSSQSCIIVYRQAEAYTGLKTYVEAVNESNKRLRYTRTAVVNKDNQTTLDPLSIDTNIGKCTEKWCDHILASGSSNGYINVNFEHTIFRGKGTNVSGYSKYEHYNGKTLPVTAEISGFGSTTGVSAKLSLNSKNTTKETYKICNENGSNCADTITLGTYNKTVCRAISSNSIHLFEYSSVVSSENIHSGACAHLFRPWNYKLSINLNIDTAVIYNEEPVSVSAKVSNSGTTEADYADTIITNEKSDPTRTPDDTKIQIFAVQVNENVATPTGNYTGASNISASNIANYIRNRIGGSSITEISLENSSGAVAASSNKTASGSYSVNVPLGTKICFVAAVNHTSSFETGTTSEVASVNGILENKEFVGYNTPANYYTISAATCATTAKKATFQVWGGSVFSDGGIVATISKSGGKSFGSWTDFGVTSNSSIENLASAAGLKNGIDSITTKTVSKMTISNNDATLGEAGVTHSGNVKNQLLSIFSSAANSVTKVTNASGDLDVSTNYTKFTSSSFDTIADPSDENADRNRYTHVKSGTHISASTDLPSGTTHVIYSDGDIYISDDFTYDNGPYINAFYVPQYLIIAQGNIYIDSDVTEVNAILISSAEINTCTESIKETHSSTEREVCQDSQLTIRGEIFAKRLNLTRSFGESVEPAELIIKSASSAFWTNTQSENYPRAVTTYLHELSPRY